MSSIITGFFSLFSWNSLQKFAVRVVLALLKHPSTQSTPTLTSITASLFSEAAVLLSASQHLRSWEHSDTTNCLHQAVENVLNIILPEGLKPWSNSSNIQSLISSQHRAGDLYSYFLFNTFWGRKGPQVRFKPWPHCGEDTGSMMYNFTNTIVT